MEEISSSIENDAKTQRLLHSTLLNYKQSVLQKMKRKSRNTIRNKLFDQVDLPWPVATKITANLVRSRTGNRGVVDKRIERMKWPNIYNTEGIILTLLQLKEIYTGCDHLSTPLPKNIDLPEYLDFGVRFGSTRIGRDWFMAGDIAKTNLYLFNSAWASFAQPIENFSEMNQAYVIIRDINRRSLIATENFLFGFYRSSISKLKMWKISPIFGSQIKQVPTTDLVSAFGDYSSWKMERCVGGIDENDIFCLLCNEWQRVTLHGNSLILLINKYGI